MDISVDIDLGQAARELALPEQSVRQTVALLDDGNTVPFITRFRKEQTGALDEEPIRRIQETVTRLRALAERKRTILKSILAQGKLSAELAEQIRAAKSTKRLEDLYLPYKPKKQSLATIARRRGLEPIAQQLLNEGIDEAALGAQAASLVEPSSGLESANDVLAGVGHIIAEWYSERADIRGRLRHLMNRTGKLVSRAMNSPVNPHDQQQTDTETKADRTATNNPRDIEGKQETAAAEPATDDPPLQTVAAAEQADSAARTAAQPETSDSVESPTDTESSQPCVPAEVTAVSPTTPTVADPPAATTDPLPVTSSATNQTADPENRHDAQAKLVKEKLARHGPLAESLQRREKKRQKLESAFKDYFSFEEKVAKMPPHRVLAINRGERARILRAKLEFDTDAIVAKTCQWLVPDEHPNAERLRSCVRDALCRLILPSLEREVRRELTDRSEKHAVEVFAKNLRTLLLQPPVQDRRILAIDPGFRNGCKLVAIDQFGNVLDHATIYIVGNKSRIKQGRAKLIELIGRHGLAVVAIGNGTACRQTEQLVGDVIATDLQNLDVSFVIVNEAGASVYSTSPLGREELPKYDATLRSAISIGRRLLDPLSELVKINPANIGVGMYQHDVKARHLQKSLDAVVESCVNYVGVDVNTASPALLRYVSGLNQLTARRLCEHRANHGPFRTREQFKEVPGFGNATFVQAAGFLKITGGDNPLDATWIHPESYPVATRLMTELRGPSEPSESREIPEVPGDDASDVQPLTDASAETETKTKTETETTGSAPAVNENGAGSDAPPPASSSDPVPAVAARDDESMTGGPPTEERPADSLPATRAVPGTDVAAHPLSSGAEHSASTAPPKETTETTDASPAVPQHNRLAPNWSSQKMAAVDLDQLSERLAVSPLLLADLLDSLRRPGRDPREDFPPPIMRRGILKLEDLKPGMELSGTVLNVVDFGVFVDIGLPDSGLVHISRLVDRFVRDPHEVVGVGDLLRVWVTNVDKQRRRVSLTAIDPAAQRAKPHRAAKPQRSAAPARPRSKRADVKTAPPHKRRPAASKPTPERKTKRPKNVTPITKAMEEGAEPLRSFSDLMQFYKKKKDQDK